MPRQVRDGSADAPNSPDPVLPSRPGRPRSGVPRNGDYPGTGAPHAAITPAEIRNYLGHQLARSFARWSPLLLATLAVGLIVAFAPVVTNPNATPGSATQGGSSSGHFAPGATGGGAGAPGTAVNGGAGAFANGSAPGAPGAAGGAYAASGGGGTAQGSSATGGVAAAYSPGTTVAGTRCGPGATQFYWSHYAPPCVPAFHGKNGGSTSSGVTGSTITLTFAEPSQATMDFVDTFAGYANLNVPAYVADMQTYAKWFNTQYELYGRKVVIKPFQAQGNFLLQDTGQDISGAQADAQTAASMPAFADVTFPLLAAAPYLQYLAMDHVISTAGLGEPNSWFAQYAPYAYSEVPTGTAAADGFGHAICARMAGLPAIFSSQYSSKARVFGLITPETPQYAEVAQEVMSTVAGTCGVHFAVWEQYSEGSLQSYQSQAISIVAKMKSEGVTTIVCGCDPIFPMQLGNAAAQQDYYPEWVAIGWGDAMTQQYNQSEWSHAISEEGQSPTEQSMNAYHVFEEASGGRPPREQYFYVAYYTLIMIDDALQLAGADLTPQTFQRGWFSMPETPKGQAGIWSGGQNAYSLNNVTTGIGWYDPQAQSYIDGKAGAWENCDNGQLFYFNNPDGWGTPHTQFACFGRASSEGSSQAAMGP